MQGPRVAYFAGTYPLLTHSFILRELDGLRALGLEIDSFALRPGPDHLWASEVALEAGRTRYLLPVSIGGLLGSHWRLLRSAPARYLKALRLAWRTFRGGWRPALYQTFYFAEAGLLAGRLLDSGVSHLHTHFATSTATVATLAAELAGLSFSFTMHGSDLYYEPARWEVEEKLARARFVVCISHFCRSQAMLLSPPEQWEKLHTVRCGVAPGKPRDPGSGPARRLLYVGRLALAKGLSVLLHSMRDIADQHPDVRLRLVGDGPDRARLEALAKSLGVNQRVEFAGPKDYDGVSQELSEADMLVHPSFCEGVSISVMEAMAHELPVICTSVFGMPELVEHGVSGWMIVPSCQSSLTTALLELIPNPECRAALGRGGRARVEGMCDPCQSARQLAALFGSRD